MPVMAKTPIPIANVTHLRSMLHELFRKRLGYRYKAGTDYSLYELWSMDNPPDTLKYTGMADRLDRIMGFHLDEKELMTAYDEPLSVASVYLFNLYKQVMKKPKVESKKEGPNGIRGNPKKLPAKA